MGVIDAAARSDRGSLGSMSPQEAIVALLIAGARADGTVSPHEANRIEHGVAAMRLFRGCSREALESIFATTMERVRQHGGAALVRAAAPVIPTELRQTAFAMTVDLLLSDGRSRHNEQRFAKDLQTLLGIDDDTAARVVEVLTVKNAG